jgi:hypothetical protein
MNRREALIAGAAAVVGTGAVEAALPSSDGLRYIFMTCEKRGVEGDLRTIHQNFESWDDEIIKGAMLEAKHHNPGRIVFGARCDTDCERQRFVALVKKYIHV